VAAYKTSDSVSFNSLLINVSGDTVNESRNDISNSYRKYTATEREIDLQGLIKQDMLLEKSMPKAGVNRIPTFYFITDKGRAWVENYQANYPE
jgi:hypothetical protein